MFFTCEIYPADIGILGNRIALVGSAGAYQLEANAYYDGSGKWACPGFVDTHLHIESSMVTPANYAAAVLPFGTTTSIIADFMGVNEHRCCAVGNDGAGEFGHGHHAGFHMHMSIAKAGHQIPPARVHQFRVIANAMVSIFTDIGKTPANYCYIKV